MTGSLQDRVSAAFARSFGGKPAGTVRAPGRVNLIGEHTDYNQGLVLPCAIGVETRIAWAPRNDRQVRVIAADFDDEQDAFSLDAITHHPGGGWRDYVRGMIAVMQARGQPLAGADLAIAGDIPRGAGLSSSASLQVAVGQAMLSAIGQSPDPVALALNAQAAESDFVGVKCGVMDQLASAASVVGSALMIDCRDLTLKPVPVRDDIAILIIHSGVVRGLVEGHYNQRRAECEAAAQALGLASLRDATLDAIAGASLPPVVAARARHVVSENARVEAATAALAAGDLETLGTLMAASHASMRDDFAITVPAIDALVEIAQAAIGPAGGARMTGGGFGGAVVALAETSRAAAVAEAIARDYRTPQDTAPLIMVERPAAGAGRVPG